MTVKDMSALICRYRQTQTHHSPTKSEKCLEQRIESRNSIFFTLRAFQPLPIEPNVPIRELIHKVQQPRDDGVQPVRRHLLAHELDERLTAREDPAIHDVVRRRQVRVIHEIKLARLAVQVHLPEEEAEGVKPREQHARHDLAYTCFAEAQVVTADDGGVDEEHPMERYQTRLTAMHPWR